MNNLQYKIKIWVRRNKIMLLLLIFVAFIIISGNGITKNNLQSHEKQIIGEWYLKTIAYEGTYIFNSDRTMVFKSPVFGERHNRWKATNTEILLDNGNTINYKLYNSDTLLIRVEGTDFAFKKTISLNNLFSFLSNIFSMSNPCFISENPPYPNGWSKEQVMAFNNNLKDNPCQVLSR